MANGLFTSSELIGGKPLDVRTKASVLIKILFDPEMRLQDRTRAYVTLSGMDPDGYPPLAVPKLIKSIVKGDLAKASEAIHPSPTPSATIEAGRNELSQQEQILYDPAADIDERVDAYFDLNEQVPELYPRTPISKLKNNILSGEIGTITKELHPEFTSPREAVAERKKREVEELKEQKVLAKEQAKEAKQFSAQQEANLLRAEGFAGQSFSMGQQAGALRQKLRELNNKIRVEDFFQDEYESILEQKSDLENQIAAHEQRSQELGSMAERLRGVKEPEGIDLMRNPEVVSGEIGQPFPGSIPQNDMFETLPEGAVQIGTQNGLPVFQTPDGQKFIGE